MALTRRTAISAAFALLLLGCDGAAPPIDAGRDAGRDAAMGVDAGRPDAGASDAGASDGGLDGGSFLDASLDGGLEPDGGMLDGGSTPQVGTITGTCGVLDDELTSPSPYFFDNVMTFEDVWSRMEAALLSEGAQEILLDGTAGGSSSYSEAFAFEVLHRCEGASLVKTETEIVYDTVGSLTDILVSIDGMRIGVSVTRAVTVTGPCMRSGTYSEAAAEDILRRKLSGILESTRNVSAGDRWVKQILFVFADTMAHVEVARRVWERLEPELRADTILYVSVSEARDAFIYFEDRCGP
jgi:hypothetical protein